MVLSVFGVRPWARPPSRRIEKRRKEAKMAVVHAKNERGGIAEKSERGGMWASGARGGQPVERAVI